jgi:HicB-like protein involved in pilus formation
MNLNHHVETVQRQLAVAAEAGGDEARALAERLTPTLDSVLRLTLLEILGEAAAEITRELAPGSVDLRLRGREPEFVVAQPPAEATTETPPEAPGEDGPMTRINLRLPDQLKTRIEQAAEREGLSINAWLVRAAASAVERSGPRGPQPRGGQQYRGWVR